MGLRVSFDLEDEDLKHFRLIMRESRKAAAGLSPSEIVQGAKELLDKVGNTTVPHFIRERLDKLELMIRMLGDADWRLPQQEAGRVMNALAYFREPEDLIPDHVPGLGFLDDAIMVELVVRELRHELEAYEDFCDYRLRDSASGSSTRRTGATPREEWLAARRAELQLRMRRRRKRSSQGTKGRAPRLL